MSLCDIVDSVLGHHSKPVNQQSKRQIAAGLGWRLGALYVLQRTDIVAPPSYTTTTRSAAAAYTEIEIALCSAG